MSITQGPVPSHMPVALPSPIKDPTGRERVYVNPPVVHIGTGSTQLRKILFTNHTGDKARYWFPGGDLLFVSPPAGYINFDNPFVVENGGKLELYLKEDLGFFDYTYHVYCDAIENEADGNSPPGISCP